MNQLLIELVRRFQELTGIPRQLTEIRQSIEDQTESIREANERADQQQRMPPLIRAEVFLAEQIDSKGKTDKERNYDVQNAIKKWTRNAFYAACIYAAIALVQWKQAGDNFKAQQRAWVSIISPTADSVGLEGQNFVIRGGYTLKNFGPTPAFQAYPILLGYPTFKELSDHHETACIVAKEWFDKGLKLDKGTPTIEQGNTVFPNQEIPFKFDAGVNGLDPDGGAPFLMGCVYYRDQFGDTRHTRFCLMAPIGKGPYPLAAVPWYNEAE